VTTLVTVRSSRVSLFKPGFLPERVQVCGRSFRISDHHDVLDRRTADARDLTLGPFEQVGELHPPLHASMEILGHSQVLQCGSVLFVGTDDDHLAEYALMGGP
jgi:hypothetical protein